MTMTMTMIWIHNEKYDNKNEHYLKLIMILLECELGCYKSIREVDSLFHQKAKWCKEKILHLWQGVLCHHLSTPPLGSLLAT
jgi:hypothetical protein